MQAAAAKRADKSLHTSGGYKVAADALNPDKSPTAKAVSDFVFSSKVDDYTPIASRNFGAGFIKPASEFKHKNNATMSTANPNVVQGQSIGKHTVLTHIAQTSPSLDPYNQNNSIKADTSQTDNISRLIEQQNQAMIKHKNSPPNVQVNVPPPTPSGQSAKLGNGTGGSAEGLSAPMIVRNPDSIIREVSISMLKNSV